MFKFCGELLIILCLEIFLLLQASCTLLGLGLAVLPVFALLFVVINLDLQVRDAMLELLYLRDKLLVILLQMLGMGLLLLS